MNKKVPFLPRLLKLIGALIIVIGFFGGMVLAGNMLSIPALEPFVYPVFLTSAIASFLAGLNTFALGAILEAVIDTRDKTGF